MAMVPTARLDIREMSFQNVVDQILMPNGVKMGGFPDEMFVDLTEEEQSEYTCNICYMVLNEPQQCDNKHLFCETCIFAWTMTYGENSQRCPVCRTAQKKYAPNRDIRKTLWDKKVKCPEEKCEYSASLRPFLMHCHGKARFSNEHVDLETLRPERPDGARLLVLPNITLQGNTTVERATSIRDQIRQGRMMIHQMMLLLHLEMQLRQQALTSYSLATDPVDRMQRLDEVMALNEQLNEVGGVLSNLLNSPMSNIIGASRDLGSAAAEPTLSTTRTSGVSDILRLAREQTGLSDSDISTSSDESQTLSRFRMDFRTTRPSESSSQQTRRIDLSHGPPTVVTSPGPGLGGMSGFDRRNAERERAALAALRNTEPSSPDIPEIPTGRYLSDLSQAGVPVTNIHPRVLLGRSSDARATRNSGNTTPLQERTRVLTTNGTRVTNVNTTPATSDTSSSTAALPSITASTSTVANSVARTSTAAPNSIARTSAPAPNSIARTNAPAPNSVARTNAAAPNSPRVIAGAQSLSHETGNTASTGTSSSSTVNAPQRLLSGRTRAQASSLSASNTSTDSNTRTPITYQSSLNAGNSTTPRIQNSVNQNALTTGNSTAPRTQNTSVLQSDNGARSGPSITSAIVPEEPVITETTTPRFEQKNAFRVSQPSSTTTSRASSASRRNSTHASPSRDVVARQPRYAPRLRQQSQNPNRNVRANMSQRTESVLSHSSDRNNNITGLNRQRDISNRLSNASYRGTVSNQTISQTGNSRENDGQFLVPNKPLTLKRIRKTTNPTAPRGPGTSGQLLRARRRSEIQEELMKSRENGK